MSTFQTRCCDRCELAITIIGASHLGWMSLELNENGNTIPKMDLCLECRKAFFLFIKEGRPKDVVSEL